MSSSFVVEPHQSGPKKDDTLIIVVNDDGTISVDQETLQNLIMNQSDANVSVVRVGQSEGDAENGDLTLTVDPPAFERTANTTAPATATSDVAALVDPFMEMDPEQLEKLETALQSEQAKQILGENVTAMLDMLTVEEQQKSIKYCIELDHCYTSRTSPSDPEPLDPLPIANSPDILDDFEAGKHPILLPPLAPLSASEPNIVNAPTTPVVRSKILLRNATTRTMATRGRKIGVTVSQQVSGVAKTSPSLSPRSASISQNSPNKATSVRVEAERKEEPTSSSSSESSESEPPSDDDSDFGPRGPRRSGGRPRGGRKGLTTRGGSTSAARRRSTNKQMDMDQVRRLDMEMAAAVVAMKSPEKPERPERFSPAKAKKRTKSVVGKKKEDSSPNPALAVNSSPPSPLPGNPTIPEASPPAVIEKPLQTTNQVKANLISANMIKGDMILTKPGQARNNQKVLFVQKRVMLRPNEVRTFGIKRQPLVMDKDGKSIPANLQLQTKLVTSEDGRLVSLGGKTISTSVEASQDPESQATPTTTPSIVSTASTATFSPSIVALELQPSQIESPAPQLPQQLLQHEPSTPEPVKEAAIATSPLKVKTMEIKREKRKSESENRVEDTPKIVDTKTPDASKKHVKKEPRKAPTVLADALGPALFSTPDIIRRVGSEAKGMDSSGTIQPSTLGQDSCPTNNAPVAPTDILVSPVNLPKISGENTSVTESQISRDSRTSTDSMSLADATMETEGLARVRNEEMKSESKIPTVEELEPSLDPATNVPPIVETPEPVRSTEEPVVPNEMISGPSGIEGEEHLLATLEMEAGKHDEELLAEALLLQEELGVDLADHPVLAEPAVSIPEQFLSQPTTYDRSSDVTDRRAEVPMKVLESVKSPETASIAPVTVTSPVVRAAVTPQVMPETPKKKDEKEPIQIIRGGRVITLPPIEAPTTRSKRLQAKPETPKKLVESPKKDERIVKQFVQSQQKTEEPETGQTNVQQDNNVNAIHYGGDDDEDDDEDDEEEENSDSEDDPDRLWCICKRPHNNRFMICCDVCEDWFHGKCVHVSKAMGQQMEEKGIEWVCPNCVKKKDPSTASSEQKKVVSTPGKVTVKLESQRPPRVATPRAAASNEKVRKLAVQPTVLPEAPPPAIPTPSVTQCVVCKKEARNSSIYCSDACILTHAQETLTRDSKPNIPAPAKVVQGTSETPVKPTSDARVIVFERKTGKVLTGTDAPTRSNLKTWLKENPTFEVVRPNNLNTLQIGGKTVTAIQTQGVGKITKSTQGSSPSAQNKMVFTKVTGSKQTVLAPSNKKLVVLSGGQQAQQQQRLSPKTVQQKAQASSSSGKSPVMRQTTIKLVSRQGVNSPTTVGSKQTTAKKQEAAKAPATSQQQQSPQQQQQQQQQQQKTVQKTPPPKKPEPEPIRLNVRKTLAELLTTRIRDCEDLSLSDDEINELGLNIELELYKYFRDTGSKYKSKYRSLVFNIKDTKNLTLFRKIADRSLTPDEVVRLSPDEMASQELAEWREKETKHQLEMIKKNELDLMSQAKSIVVKTHKGELIIENESHADLVDPKTPVQDIVTALNEAGIEESREESNKAGHSLGGEDSRWSKSSITSTGTSTTNPSEDKKKKDRERVRDKERGDSKSSSTKSADKESGKASRPKRIEDEERRRSHSRGRSRRSRDRERSRDRKSTRSKDGKREIDKEGKDRERHKGGKEGRQRDKDRERRSRGKNKDHRSRSSRDEEGGRGGSKREPGEKKSDSSGAQQTGRGDGVDANPIEDRLWRHIEEESTTATMTMSTTTMLNPLTPDGNDSDVSDREPSSTVNIKTPDINEESEREKEIPPTIVEAPQLQKQGLGKASSSQTVWRGFVNMVDVAKFFITAQEVSGQARDLMEDLPDTVDVVGRISHETVWDYISKMRKTGSKEILVIRLTAANDEEKIPYITLYSYLNSRSRLGVVGNVSKNIKDFYIMPFSRQSQIPAVLLPLVGPGFEDQRPHLLLGIIVRNKRKRVSNVSSPVPGPPAKIPKKEGDETSLDTSGNVRHHHHHHHHHLLQQSPPDSPRPIHKGLLLESLREKKTSVTQMTLETLNKAHVGMSRSAIIDNATISKLVPELSSKIDLCESPTDETTPPLIARASPTTVDAPDEITPEDEPDDGDEPYSPGGATDVDEPEDLDNIRVAKPNPLDIATSVSSLLSPTKNSTELQRKMDELNRQIEEQKQQIQSISSSFLGDSVTALPGLGLDLPEAGDSDEAYSPTDARSFTPPPIAKFAQPLLDKVSDITIPPNLQEILANVKRQESSKIDPYLPSKPSATFLTSSNPPMYPVKTTDKYTPTFINKNVPPQGTIETSPPPASKETKSTLRSLSDLDLIKKAEEELAAVAAADAASVSTPTNLPKLDSPVVPTPPPTFSMPPPPPPPPPPPLPSIQVSVDSPSPEPRDPSPEMAPYGSPILPEPEKKTGSNISLEQPKPPGLEDEDLPVMFPTTPAPIPSFETVSKTPLKFIPKSGVVLSVKRKVSEDGAPTVTPVKAPRTKSRWGQGPAE